MKTTARSRLGWLRLVLVSGVGAGLVTLGLTWLMILMTPPCPGPWCLEVLIYLPVSGIGAAIVAIVVAAYARLGTGGYLAALASGTVGYLVAWQVISGGNLIRL